MDKKIKNGIIYYKFKHFAKTELVNHCFSTRIGGVSKPPYNEMNLAYHMGDDPDDVDENFRLICKAVGFDYEKIIMTNQEHKANYQVITDKGKIEKPTDILITSTPELVLTSYHADCVPLLYLDPVKKVIANAHAGWRGTMADVCIKTLNSMKEHFDCRVEDILIGIAPCISFDHFEVEKDIVDKMKHHHNSPECFKQKTDDKWLINLAEINRQRLIQKGILEKNIEIANICTFKNPDLLFSHRRDGKSRGNMAAMIALK